jgi:hypothetical protein
MCELEKVERDVTVRPCVKFQEANHGDFAQKHTIDLADG